MSITSNCLLANLTDLAHWGSERAIYNCKEPDRWTVVPTRDQGMTAATRQEHSGDITVQLGNYSRVDRMCRTGRHGYATILRCGRRLLGALAVVLSVLATRSRLSGGYYLERLGRLGPPVGEVESEDGPLRSGATRPGAVRA
jgi:hypothetical protein